MVSNEAMPFSWDAVQESTPWRNLTPQQRLWVLAFVTNGRDPIAATETAYHCASPANTRALSYEVRKHRDVLTFLEFFKVLTQGAPSREEQISGVLQTIREAPPYEQVRARRLLALLTGCVDSTDESETEPEAKAAPQIPADALEVWSDPKTGICIGYRAANGEAVKL